MNIIIKKVQSSKFKVQSYWRWHPKVALRYLPIVKQIKNLKLKMKNDNLKLKILEVGSGSLGIAPYLRMPVTGVDIDFSGPRFPLLKQVYGRATNLPFPDKSFDYVICVDLLEHLPKKKREKVIQEILRVTRTEAAIAIPCGKRALEQDKELAQKYRQVFKKDFPFFKEHLKFKLPQKKGILDLIKKSERETAVKVIGNENLRLRHFLMWGWMTKNIFIDFVFRKAMLLFIPLFRFLDRPLYYRQIFFVKINPEVSSGKGPETSSG